MVDVRSDGFSPKTLRIPGYTILGLIGKGGMGAVFRARQDAMDRIVAVKVLPPKLAADKGYLERFLREARASAKLNHPNIIQGIDCGQVGDTAYFVMEYVEGSSWGDVIKQRGALPWREVLGVGIQIGRALDHAHKIGLIHRDVKPDNVLIAKNGEAKLVDLGLAKEIAHADDAHLTLAGNAVGTPHYISPEQAQGRQDLDIRADIYSLGATLYHALSGHSLFKAPTAAAVMAAHMIQTMPSLRYERPELPESLLAVLSKMLAKSANERYATPEQMIAELEAVLADMPVPKAAAFRGKSSLETTKVQRPVVLPVDHKKTAVRPAVQVKSNLPVLALAGGGLMLVVAAVIFGSAGGSGSTNTAENIKPLPRKNAPVPIPNTPRAPSVDPLAERAARAASALESAKALPEDAADPLPALVRLWNMRDTVRNTPSEAKWNEALATARTSVLKFLQARADRAALLELQTSYTAEPGAALFQQVLQEFEKPLLEKWQSVEAAVARLVQASRYAEARQLLAPFLRDPVQAIAEAASREDVRLTELERQLGEQEARKLAAEREKLERVRCDMYWKVLFVLTRDLKIDEAKSALTTLMGRPEAKVLTAEIEAVRKELDEFAAQIDAAGKLMEKKSADISFSINPGKLDPKLERGKVSSYKDGAFTVSKGGGASLSPRFAHLTQETVLKEAGWKEQDKALEAARFMFWRQQLDEARRCLPTPSTKLEKELVDRIDMLISGADRFYKPDKPEQLKVVLPKELTGADNRLAVAADAVYVDLNWAPTPNTQYYRVERRASDVPYAAVGQTPKPPFKDTQPPLGTTLTYRVVACNSCGDSPVSDEQTLKLPPARSLIPGDFESDQGWEMRPGASLTQSGGHNSKKALQISSSGAAKSFGVKPDTNYIVTGWIKVTSQSANSWGGVRACVADGDGKLLGESPLYVQNTSNKLQKQAKEWTQFKFAFKATSAQARIQLENFGPANVSLDALVDDVIIDEQP